MPDLLERGVLLHRARRADVDCAQQIRPSRPALMQSVRASATSLDPPSEWLTQRAPPLPKLTQSASADNPRLPVFADESHAKNSATVRPTKMARRTDQSDFARRPPAKIHLDGRQPRTRACAQNVPEHDDLRDEAIIPNPTRSAGRRKNSISKGAARNKGNVKLRPERSASLRAIAVPAPARSPARPATRPSPSRPRPRNANRETALRLSRRVRQRP